MNQQLKYSLGFALLGALFYIPFLGGVHLFDWDEINFAEITREMMLTQDYTRVYVDFKPFWEKPPFYFWVQLLSMETFGINEFAARLPNAICGIISLVLLYNIGRKLYNHTFGVIWAGVYFGTLLPFLYSKSGIIDPFFNLFIFLGLYFFILFYWKKDKFEGIDLTYKPLVYLFWAGFFIGMGILTKGQVAFLIACLTFFVYWVYQRFRMYINIPEFLFFVLCCTLVTLTWYGLETWKNGPWFINEFNKYQYRLFSTPDAGHRGFLGYHFVVLLVGCFPASIFTIRTFFKMPSESADHQVDFRRWMKFLFWVVLILFTIVKSKIVHYSSMCYYPLTFLAALAIYRIIQGEIKLNGWMRFGLFAVGGLFVFVTIALPFVGMNIEILKPLFAADPFAQANLDAEVNWTGWETIPGFFLLAILVLSVRRIRRQQAPQGFQILFGGTAIFIMLTLIFYIAKIETYSQRAAMEFWKSTVDKDVYTMSYRFKTYGSLFYGKKPMGWRIEGTDKQWMLNGEVDKDVYITAKVNTADELRGRAGYEELYEKNGFVFFKRNKVK